MSISFQLSTHMGTLLLNGVIDHDVAFEFEAGLDLLCDYYQFEQVRLEINSGGGQVAALDQMLASVQRWRRAGRQVATRARFRAGSAAATLLAMGDVGTRCVSSSTILLFHPTRIEGGDATITAHAATSLGALLQGVDLLHLGRLTEHQLRGFGGWHALATEGAARCQQLEKESSGRRSSRLGRGLPTELIGRQSLGAAARVFAQCLARHSIEPYQRMLSRRFAEDRRMPPSEAWALCLVDGIAERPDLQSHCQPERPLIGEPAARHLRPAV